MTTSPAALSADRPSTDPAQDLFGHAPFARTLAQAIRSYVGSDGIVLALYGPWGSGKSTVLEYVQHELAKGPEQDRPVVVPFNPWWFSGQEHLAKAFLGQLQAVLPSKYEKFRAFGDKISEFSEALGGLGDIVGTATGQGWIGKAVRGGARLAGRKPKDVPALKRALSDILLEQKKRVLIVIDDIDRLAPDEVRQLFTVIKALADFPYVTYLLAFDREVAATAISEQTGLPGDRYLEKIVQVPFELPRVDRTTLRQALFARLDAVMSPTPEGRFDSGHWSNVFHSGLDPLFSVPRDIVRLTNALSVTYPAVVGEVNPVDFIAVECLRVFLPSVYDAVRMAPEKFTGYRAPGDGAERQRDVAFHDAWLAKVPEQLRGSTKALVTRLFPRLESVWSNNHYTADSFQEWRRALRVCCEDVFPAYFRLSLPLGAVSRADLDALLALAEDPRAFAAALSAAVHIRGATGISKARALLERFMDFVPEQLTAEHAQPVITALFDVGDELLLADRIQSGFDFGNESRVTRIAYHLLKKLDPAARVPVLQQAIQNGCALRCSEYLLGYLADETEKAAKGEGEALLTAAGTESLKNAWRARVREMSQAPEFIDRPSLAELLSGWRHWGGEEEAKSWWRHATASDQGLLKLIAAFASESTSHTFGEHALRVHLRVNPKWIAPYDDVQALAKRVDGLVRAGSVPDQYAPAAKQFVSEVQRMQAGKDPDAFSFDDR